jgi:predicted  nucleic acid-binding Zn-ribbon protein
MPIQKLAGNYCSLLFTDLYLVKKIDTKKIKYEALKSSCSTSTLTLQQIADLETMKNRISEKKRAVEVLETEMEIIEEEIFNLLEHLDVNAID